MKKNTPDITRILTGAWKDNLKKLPEHLKGELRKWSAIKQALEALKFGLINFDEFQKRLEALNQERATGERICKLDRQTKRIEAMTDKIERLVSSGPK